MHRTDEEIVQEILAGNKQRYAEIVSRYQRPVFNLMYRYTRHEQDAADLTQDVFLKAFDRLSTYRTGCSLFTWLYTMAVSRANDWSRSHRRRQERMEAYLQEDDVRPEASNPRVGFEGREESQLLQQALDLLPPATREILLLRYRHEQPVREVAAVFGITESAAKMRVKRGLEQLQEIMLERHGHETKFF
jgi:RNA polymerase sigma-70 factor (ECF subfamily)